MVWSNCASQPPIPTGLFSNIQPSSFPQPSRPLFDRHPTLPTSYPSRAQPPQLTTRQLWPKSPSSQPILATPPLPPAPPPHPLGPLEAQASPSKPSPSPSPISPITSNVCPTSVILNPTFKPPHPQPPPPSSPQ
ncbi:hypothetical protein Salat_2127200 [Sesamum alatum]|uniref:Uncharacterized protein n=1 Tax=Sesamum alatum TaxID=300844 RepID=A0AAE1Y0Y5_9LAMI|nr:hypothetical protein Salat_2127200 [Sesamum alatum]